MKRTFPFSRILTVLLAMAVVTSLIGLAAMQALAQSDDPASTAEPDATMEAPAAADATAASDVEWTVNDMTFQSNYPSGFEFTLDITSSAAPVARGRVVWTHAVGTNSQRSQPADLDPETGKLVANWVVQGGDAVPPWVGVTYRWQVSDEAGNAFETEPEYVEYEDTSREWLRVESEDVIVFTEGLPEEVGPLTVDAMAQQRETYRQAWGDLLPYKPRAILFGDQDAWLEWRLGLQNPRVIGTTDEHWGATVQIIYGGDMEDLAYGTVPHEVGHLYQGQFTIMTPGSWFIEGNATFFEIHQQYDYEASVRELAASGQLPALLQDTGPGVSGNNARRGYDIGYTFWKWLVDNYGLDGHRELIELLDKGLSRNEALQTVTGLSLQEIESRWRVWLGASATPPTLYPTPTMFFFPTVTPYGQ